MPKGKGKNEEKDSVNKENLTVISSPKSKELTKLKRVYKKKFSEIFKNKDIKKRKLETSQVNELKKLLSVESKDNKYFFEAESEYLDTLNDRTLKRILKKLKLPKEKLKDCLRYLKLHVLLNKVRKDFQEEEGLKRLQKLSAEDLEKLSKVNVVIFTINLNQAKPCVFKSVFIFLIN